LQHVVMPKDLAFVVALWIGQSWIHHHGTYSPILGVTSATRFGQVYPYGSDCLPGPTFALERGRECCGTLSLDREVEPDLRCRLSRRRVRRQSRSAASH